MRSRRRGAALSVTGCPAVTRCAAPAAADEPAPDLTAIWSCDALLDRLAGRRLRGSVSERDPALAVLSMLAADVDAPAVAARPGRQAEGAAGQPEGLAAGQAERHAVGGAAARGTAAPPTAGRGSAGQGTGAPSAAVPSAAVPCIAVPVTAGRSTGRTAARARSGIGAAIAGTLLAALALAAVAAASTGLLAVGMLTRVARLGTGAPGGSARRAPRHGRPARGLQARLRDRPARPDR